MQQCIHEDVDDHCLRETWCTPELHEAIKQGYEVLEIYEIYHFEKNNEDFLTVC